MSLSFDQIDSSLRRVMKDALAEASTHGADPPLALVAFDTPGIQRYLFKVRRPVDIFSGSRLIDDFTARDGSPKVSLYQHLAKAGISEDAVIYAGGGGGLILVPAHRADDVRRLLEDILHRETEGDLSSAVATLAIRPEDLDAEPAASASEEGLSDLFGAPRATSRYAATLAAVTALLARERSRRGELAPAIPGDRQDDRCTACGSRLGKPRREEKLCSPCSKRRDFGGVAKKEEAQAKTFEDVVEGTGSKMMAVIYADGANVGAAFQELESMAQHKALSLMVEHAFREAEKSARKASPLPEKEGDRLRFQTPLCGGDDLVLVLPAVAALPAVKAMVPEIEKTFEFKENPQLRDAFGEAPEGLRTAIERFGVGVGIAIADHHFPMRFLLGYAKELLRSAKRKIRESGCRSAVDFMVLTSGNPLSGSIRGLRETRYRVPARAGEPELRLTRRPYSFWEFVELLHHTTELIRVPPTQIYAMRQELLRGYGLSRSLWRYQHARDREGNREGKGWAAYRKARHVTLDDAAALDALLWRDAGDAKSTDLLDAVEILGLLRRGPASAEDAP